MREPINTGQSFAKEIFLFSTAVDEIKSNWVHTELTLID